MGELKAEAEMQKALNKGGSTNPRGNGFNGPIGRLNAAPCPERRAAVRTRQTITSVENWPKAARFNRLQQITLNNDLFLWSWISHIWFTA